MDTFDAVVLPGGFAHGDHLRAGAIARFAPVMSGIERFARRGGLVLGICNGFQVLLEAGLLPGAMLRNASLEFRSQWVHCRVERTDSPFLSACRPGQVLRLPIAHGEGNYVSLDGGAALGSGSALDPGCPPPGRPVDGRPVCCPVGGTYCASAGFRVRRTSVRSARQAEWTISSPGRTPAWA
jgi:hypothetical protein